MRIREAANGLTVAITGPLSSSSNIQSTVFDCCSLLIKTSLIIETSQRVSCRIDLSSMISNYISMKSYKSQDSIPDQKPGVE